VIGLLFCAIVVEKTQLIGFLAVLAALTRPEGMLCVLCLPLLKQARNVRFLGSVGLALFVAFLVRLAVFGDVLPNTYFAKSGGTARHAELGLDYLWSFAQDFPLVVLSPLALFMPRARPATIYIGVVAVIWFGSFLRTGGDTFGYSRLARLVEASQVSPIRREHLHAHPCGFDADVDLARATHGDVTVHWPERLAAGWQLEPVGDGLVAGDSCRNYRVLRVGGRRADHRAKQ
jgi:hypothetical protein